MIDDLTKENKFRVTWQEFVNVCSKQGLSEKQSEQLCGELEKQGKALHLRQSTANFVYIDLPAVTGALKQVLDPNGVTQAKIVAEKKTMLGDLAVEYEKLAHQYETLEREAGKHSKRVIWSMVSYLTLQSIVVTRLTFWDLSWDIMEPITYMG